MSLGIAFRAFIVALADHVEQNKIGQDSTGARVWFQRRSQNEEISLGGDSFGIVETAFDIEVISNDIDDCLDTADAIKAALHGYRGDMNGITVQGMFVADHSDDYIPYNLDADDGEHIAAIDVQIFSSAE